MNKYDYGIIKHNLNYGYGNLKWTGTFWVVGKNSCANLNPDSVWLQNRKHNCEHKGHPIKLVPRTDQGFSVTDEKLEEMQKDGRLDTLQSIGIRVDGGVDPLYFDWHNKIAQTLKNIPKRTNSQYMSFYPYLELPTFDEIDLETGDNLIEYVSNKASEFYTGESIPQRHEATLNFINQSNDLELLKNAKNRYENVIEDMNQANDNPTQNSIEGAFNKGMELIGSNPVTGILSFGYDRIKRLVRVMTSINQAELDRINKRIKELGGASPFDKLVSSKTVSKTVSQSIKNTVKDDKKLNKYVIPSIAIITTIGLLKYFKI